MTGRNASEYAIKEYATAYSKILTSKGRSYFYHIYIDAFAGAGKHVSKNTGEFVLGSPVNALLVSPPFKEYHLIDLNKQKINPSEYFQDHGIMFLFITAIVTL